MNAKEIISAFEFRFACKKFNPDKKIKDSDFHVILEAGRLSPSSFGFEPTHLLVVQNPLLREKIKEVAWGQGQVTSCSHLVMLLTLKPEYMKADSEHLKKFLLQVKRLQNDDLAMRLKYYEHFLKDEYKLLDDEQKMLDWSSKQAYIILGNMLTTAAMLGIDSCPMEGFNPERMAEVLKNDLHIDTDMYSLSVMAAFGYRDMEAPHKTRQDLDNFVTWLI